MYRGPSGVSTRSTLPESLSIHIPATLPDSQNTEGDRALAGRKRFAPLSMQRSRKKLILKKIWLQGPDLLGVLRPPTVPDGIWGCQAICGKNDINSNSAPGRGWSRYSFPHSCCNLRVAN